MKRVVILGNRGFIGSHLERHFRSKNPDLETVGRDLPDFDMTSVDDVKKLSRLFGMDTIVIMLSAIKRQFGDTVEAFNKNLKMTINLCHLLQTYSVGRFVFFSSAAVYGEDIHNTNITEETPVNPTSYYGMMKFTSERLYWKVLSQSEKTSLLILRPPTIYGPGDKGLTYGPVKFISSAVKGEEITLWGDGTELRDFVFINDVAEIVFKLTFSSYSGVINLASGISHSYCDILKVVESFSGRKLDVTSRPRTKAKVDNIFDNRKLLSAIGGHYFTPMQQGVKALYEHILSETNVPISNS